MEKEESKTMTQAMQLCLDNIVDGSDWIMGQYVCTIYPKWVSEMNKPPCYCRQGQVFEHKGKRYAICERENNDR